MHTYMASTLVWLSSDGKICVLKWCVYKTPSCKNMVTLEMITRDHVIYVPVILKCMGLLGGLESSPVPLDSLSVSFLLIIWRVV